MSSFRLVFRWTSGSSGDVMVFRKILRRSDWERIVCPTRVQLPKMSPEDRRLCGETSDNIAEGTNGFWGQLARVHYPLKDGDYKDDEITRPWSLCKRLIILWFQAPHYGQQATSFNVEDRFLQRGDGPQGAARSRPAGRLFGRTLALMQNCTSVPALPLNAAEWCIMVLHILTCTTFCHSQRQDAFVQI